MKKSTKTNLFEKDLHLTQIYNFFITLQSVTLIENNKINLFVYVLLDMLEALGITPEEFFAELSNISK